MRPGQEVQKRVVQKEGFQAVNVVIGVVFNRGCELPANQTRCVQTEPGNNQGVEAFNTNVSVISGKQLQCFPAELAVPWAVFQLHDQSLAAVNGGQYFGEQGDALVCPAETQL